MRFEKWLSPEARERHALFLNGTWLFVQEFEDRVLLQEFRNNRVTWEKTIREVEKSQVATLEVLGEGEGDSLAHCILLGWKHQQGFLEQIQVFRAEPPIQFFAKVRFVFYGTKPS